MNIRTLLILLLSSALFLPGALPQSDKPAPTTKESRSKASKATAQDIANAKSQGLVWVNLGTGVYHKSGEFYGNTKRGKFLTEDDAKKQGYREAKQPEKPAEPKKGDQSGHDSTSKTHDSTPPKP